MKKKLIIVMQELYGVGARRIGVFSIPVIGCVPSQRTLGGGMQRACSNSTNQAAIMFNSKLFSKMSSLRKKFSDAKFVYLESYSTFMDILQHPHKYGIVTN